VTHAVHELILMRHAKAAPASIDGNDFDRPLTAAGRTAAAQAARQLAGVRIARLLYSPARRTQETAAIVAAQLHLAAALLQAVPELYLATPAAIRAAVRAHRGAASHVLIIGHNPGLSELGGELGERYADRHLATAGVWRLPMDATGWRAL
jgi:phosphohistidine phosphatase